MGRRANLKDIAYGLTQSFLSRNNSVDGYWALGKLHLLARRQGKTSLSIDLWGGASDGAAASEVAEVRARYAYWLGRALQRHALPATMLKHASVTVEFERHDLRASARARGYPDLPPFLCTVALLDDRSKTYVCQATGASRPHDPLMESRSARKPVHGPGAR